MPRGILRTTGNPVDATLYVHNRTVLGFATGSVGRAEVESRVVWSVTSMTEHLGNSRFENRVSGLR